MSDDELDAYNAARKKRAKEHSTANVKRWTAKARAKDLQGFLAKRLKSRLAWQDKNMDRVLQTAAGVRARAKESRRHECLTCNMCLASSTALRKHLASKAHQEQVRLAASGTPKPASAIAVKARKLVAEKRASKAYFCATCDKAFNSKGHLTKHLRSNKHIKKAAAASA